MAFKPLNALRTGASWLVSACVILVTVGLMLLAYGLWRAPVTRPEAEEWRQQLQRRHEKFLQLSESPAILRNRAELPQLARVLELLNDSRRVHSASIDRLLESDSTIWNWHGAVATTCKDAGQQVEHWFVFHSDKLDLRKVELRHLDTHELLYAFRFETDGSMTFRREKDGAAFTCHTNGALATASLRLAEGSTWEATWDKDGALISRHPTSGK